VAWRLCAARATPVGEGPLVPLLDPGRRDHLRADETGSEAAPLPPEGLDADAGHRREDDARGHRAAADRPELLEAARHPGMVAGAYWRGVSAGIPSAPADGRSAAGR